MQVIAIPCLDNVAVAAGIPGTSTTPGISTGLSNVTTVLLFHSLATTLGLKNPKSIAVHSVRATMVRVRIYFNLQKAIAGRVRRTSPSRASCR
jgi:hypothetical protein